MTSTTSKNDSISTWNSLFTFCCFAIATIFLLAFFSYTAFNRLVAKDEGFYLMAISQVISGKNIYLDFFFPQMPLLPYAYALCAKFLGISWISCRLFSAFIATLLGLCIYGEVRRRWGNFFAIIAALLFAFCNYVFPWDVTITTYALGTFFIFLSYRFLVRSTNFFHYIIAGLAFGLAVETRLMLAGIFPLILLWIFNNNESKKVALYRIILFSLGCFITLLPAFYLYINHTDVFLYNNLGYHLERSTISNSEQQDGILKILGIIFGFIKTLKYDAPQMPILLWLNLGAFIFTLLSKKKVDLSFYYIFSLLIINLLPKPSYIQYFATLIPFLIMGVFIFFSLAFEWLKRKSNFLFLIFLIVPLLLIGLYFYHVPSDYIRYTYIFDEETSNSIQDFLGYSSKVNSGDGVIGIGNLRNAANWNLNKINMIKARIDSLTKDQEEVFSFWPGFLIGTHAIPVNGLENHFSFIASNNLKEKDHYLIKILKNIAGVFNKANTTIPESNISIAERKKLYHLINLSDVKELLKSSDINLFIMERKLIRHGFLKDELTSHNFHIVEEIPPVIIFKRSK